MIRTALLAGAAVVLLGAMTPAFADVSVHFWNYNNGGGNIGDANQQADSSNPILATSPNATFTYTGPIDWSTSNSANLVSEFLNLGDVTNFNSATYASVTDFGNVSLSSAPFSTTSFFEITGAGTFTGGSISHDDGASLYVDGSTVVDSAGPTSLDVSPFSGLSDTLHSYTLDYVEANGAPSVLTFTTTGGVPELSTWAMMGLGFAGLGFAGMRASKRAPAAIA
jgi:hypothetical protein